MKILVVSDTHRKIQRVLDIYRKLIRTSSVDLVVHCGDYYSDAKQIWDTLGAKILAVKGNCDGCFEEDEYAILETEAGNFFVCHGHMQNIKYNKQDLYYSALEHDCIGVIYGHTHRADKTELGDFLFLNPGSITKPRDGSGGSFALLSTDGGKVSAKILKYDAFMASDSDPFSGGSKSKVKGGFLRGLLNYSDRL